VKPAVLEWEPFDKASRYRSSFLTIKLKQSVKDQRRSAPLSLPEGPQREKSALGKRSYDFSNRDCSSLIRPISISV